MDDGSSDDTVKIARQYLDERIRVFESAKNSGQSVQLNKGIQQAAADYICIMHSDDIMYPERLERQLNFLRKNPLTGVCGCFVQLIGNRSGTWTYPEKNQECKDLLLRAVPFAHPAVMMRKSVLQQISPVYTPGMAAAEDYDLWVKLADKTAFGNVQEVLLQYRIHETQLSETKKKEENDMVECIRTKLITNLFQITDNAEGMNCFRAVYQPGQLNLEEYLESLQIFWKAAQQQSVFSTAAISNILKHSIFNTLSATNFSKRIYYLLKHRFLFKIAGYKTITRILFSH